jgi:nucleotide-binding universal stress UspA family protein
VLEVITLGAERTEARGRLRTMPDVDDCMVLIAGNPARALRDLAGRCALLVVGARPRSSFGRIVFTATSDSLTHDIPCPLLAVPRVPAPAATDAWATSAPAIGVST